LKGEPVKIRLLTGTLIYVDKERKILIISLDGFETSFEVSDEWTEKDFKKLAGLLNDEIEFIYDIERRIITEVRYWDENEEKWIFIGKKQSIPHKRREL
jgi:hypothetical protein